MPSKPDTYGLKIWQIADLVNGYGFKAQVYLEKQGNLPEIGLGQRIVYDLIGG